MHQHTSPFPAVIIQVILDCYAKKKQLRVALKCTFQISYQLFRTEKKLLPRNGD